MRYALQVPTVENTLQETPDCPHRLASPATALSIPQYYRARQIADRLAVCEKTIVRRVKDDPDVLVICEREGKGFTKVIKRRDE
jgi:hypothetical protein